MVFSPFEANGDLWSLPTWRLDPTRRCLIVPLELRPQLLDVLHRSCDVDDESDATAWIGELFSIVPARHRERVYRSLAMVCHPDSGGSHALMTALNREYEKHG